jgi:hypothetical protein
MRRSSATYWNMTDGALGSEAMKLGLLMEAAQAQQRLGQESLERLAAHARELDGIVREEVRRTLAEELGSLASDSRRATEALQRLRRAANARTLLWTAAVSAVCCAVAIVTVWEMLPSRRQMAALRARRNELTASIARLRALGGGVELKRCGSRARLCVRVDRHAPAYGADGDYLIVKGY